MRRIRVPRSLLLSIGVIALVLLSFSPVEASFFQIAENCPSGLGNAFAAGAAAADNACTVWFNPAGMTNLEGSNLLVGLHGIIPSIDYVDRGSTTFFGAPLTGGDGGDGGQSAVVPNLYFTQSIGDRMAWGIGINAPFGLETDYEPGWIGRYYALNSDIVTVNINPSFAFKVTEQFSLGVGVNYQTIDATLSQAVDFGSTCLAGELGGALPVGTCAVFGQVPQGSDATSKVEADDTAWGFNGGVLWAPNDFFRIGLHYRSKLDYDLEGDNQFTFPNAGTAAFATLLGLGDSGAAAAVELPENFSASFWWMASKRWAIMGDATQTGWASLPELRITFDNGAPDSVVTLGLDDTWRYSLGGTYYGSQKWAWRLGLALDESPVPNDELRTPRLPDADRTWYTTGFDYNFSPKMGINVSYAYIDIDKSEIDKTAAPGSEDFLRGNFTGEFDFGVQIISAQFSWKFGGGN